MKALKIIHRITYYLGLIGTFMLLAMMLLTVADVSARSLANKPIPGAYEMVAYMLVVVVLFGMAYTEQRGGNIGVDFLFQRYSPRWKAITVSIFTFLALAFFSIMVWTGWEEAVDTISFGTSSEILHIPAFPFKFLIPFGSLMLCIQLILNFIPSERRRKQREKTEATYD